MTEAVPADLLAYLPDQIPFPKCHKHLPTVLSQEEVTRLIDSAGSVRAGIAAERVSLVVFPGKQELSYLTQMRQSAGVDLTAFLPGEHTNVTATLSGRNHSR
jgi:hypothetical protein